MKKYVNCLSFLVSGALLLNAPFVCSQDNGGSISPRNIGVEAALNLGSSGIGVSLFGKTPWHFLPQDQVQFIVSLDGISGDDLDLEVNNSDYKAELDHYAIRGGLNWYPFSGNRFSRNVYFSSGLLYASSDIKAKADFNKSVKVGGRSVKKGNVQELNLDIDQSGVAPYLSLGWGGYISERSGFMFRAELGATLIDINETVKLSAKDSQGFLTKAELEKEKNEIEKDLDGVEGFFNISLSYRF